MGWLLWSLQSPRAASATSSSPSMPTAAPAPTPAPTTADGDDTTGPDTSRSPPAVRPASPPRLAAEPWADWYAPEDRQRPHWDYDAHPDHHNWNASAQGHGAALLLNAAYDSGSGPALDLRWHRPDQHEADPFGYNQRGDVAPPRVHSALDSALSGRAQSALETQLLHSWVDGVWLRHSRSQARCSEAVRRLDFFTEDEVASLCEAMRAEPLTDFRTVLHCVDPRERPVYGRTLDGEGRSRLFRMFPLTLQRDRAQWDEDDGGLSGSSAAASDEEVPFELTAEQREEQGMRHIERRMRRALPRVRALQEAMGQVEARLREMEGNAAQADVVAAVLRRGLLAPSGDSGLNFWDGWS